MLIPHMCEMLNYNFSDLLHHNTRAMKSENLG